MNRKYILIILALSLVTRFVFFSQPAETVFDEVHFGKFVSGYFTGEYFFDIHPPLGKLIIAGMLKIRDFLPRSEPKVLLLGSFKNIGQKFSDDSYKWLRFLPKLAGALVPLVVFLIAIELGISQKFAFLAGLLLIFENSLLAQSRFILLDSFLLLFGFLGTLLYLKYQKSISYGRSFMTNTFYLFLAGTFASLAASVKWTGLGFLGLIGLFYFINWLKSNRKLKSAINGLIFLAVIPFVIYFSIFAIHFSLLPNPGPGLAFHPPSFQQMNIFDKFIELNSELYQSNSRLAASHPYSSQWYSWPLMIRPIYYWNSSPISNSKIYLLGNPLIWWLSTIAVIYSLINFWKFKNKVYYFLISGFLINWLPFIFIGRVMFLYHYFTSLIFAILILCLQLDRRRGPAPPYPHSAQSANLRTMGDPQSGHPLYLLIMISSIILFFFFSPLTYGFAIPEWYYNLLIWLPSWK